MRQPPEPRRRRPSGEDQVQGSALLGCWGKAPTGDRHDPAVGTGRIIPMGGSARGVGGIP